MTWTGTVAYSAKTGLYRAELRTEINGELVVVAREDADKAAAVVAAKTTADEVRAGAAEPLTYTN